MKTEIRRVLCATDLSGNCNHVYSAAMKLASERGAGLVVVHVISRKSIQWAKTLAGFLNESPKAVVREKTQSALLLMKEQLNSFLKRESGQHPEYTEILEHMFVYPGKVADEIVEKAHRFGCEAVVLGAHHTGFFKRLFSSDTAANVLRRTKTPVFLASIKEGKLIITECSK